MCVCVGGDLNFLGLLPKCYELSIFLHLCPAVKKSRVVVFYVVSGINREHLYAQGSGILSENSSGHFFCLRLVTGVTSQTGCVLR